MACASDPRSFRKMVIVLPQTGAPRDAEADHERDARCAEMNGYTNVDPFIQFLVS